MNEYEFILQNDAPIEIEYVADEHDESRDFTPSFWFENSRHYLSDYQRTHNNPWFYAHEIPENIHAVEIDEYYDPLYLELIDDVAVNVYRECKKG